MTSARDVNVQTDAKPTFKRLTSAQYDSFHRDGFLLVPGLFAAEELEPLQRLIREEALVAAHITRVPDSDGNPVDLFGWSGTTDDVLGAYVRIARLVESTEDLFGGEAIYHWHSKLSIKQPNSLGRWDWHQDYGFWYYDGCVWPDMLSVMVALDTNTKANGCVELVRGSHKMGRIEHGPVGQAIGANMEVVERALSVMERVYCELDPGDAVFFHSNTLHASGPNTTAAPRTLLHVSYNTSRNQPWKPLSAHPYAPLPVLPDDVLKERAFNASIDLEHFTAFDLAREQQREKTGDTFGYRALFKKIASK